MMSVSTPTVVAMNPWRQAGEHPELTITLKLLPPGLLGYCDHDTDTIYLDKRMKQRQMRSVLTHELSHWRRGKVPIEPHLRQREERACHQETALDLIPFDALVEAIAHAYDEYEMAEELWVSVAAVRSRLAMLSEAERRLIADEIDRREIRSA